MVMRSVGEVSFKRGQWSPEEDQKLIAYIHKYGIWNWNHMAYFSGLTRSGKSCRLRWMNYLRPNIKHGNFSKDEEEIIVNMQQQLGNKWSLIASRLSGRTDNEIKNYWNTRVKRRIKQKLRLSKIIRSETFMNSPGNSEYGSSSNPTGLEVSSNLSYSSSSVVIEGDDEKMMEPFELVMELGSLWEEPFQVKSSEAIHIQNKDPLPLCAFFDGDVIW